MTLRHQQLSALYYYVDANAERICVYARLPVDTWCYTMAIWLLGSCEVTQRRVGLVRNCLTSGWAVPSKSACWYLTGHVNVWIKCSVVQRDVKSVVYLTTGKVKPWKPL